MLGALMSLFFPTRTRSPAMLCSWWSSRTSQRTSENIPVGSRVGLTHMACVVNASECLRFIGLSQWLGLFMHPAFCHSKLLWANGLFCEALAPWGKDFSSRPRRQQWWLPYGRWIKSGRRRVSLWARSRSCYFLLPFWSFSNGETMSKSCEKLQGRLIPVSWEWVSKNSKKFLHLTVRGWGGFTLGVWGASAGANLWHFSLGAQLGLCRGSLAAVWVDLKGLHMDWAWVFAVLDFFFVFIIEVFGMVVDILRLFVYFCIFWMAAALWGWLDGFWCWFGSKFLFETKLLNVTPCWVLGF